MAVVEVDRERALAHALHHIAQVAGQRLYDPFPVTKGVLEPPQDALGGKAMLHHRGVKRTKHFGQAEVRA